MRGALNDTAAGLPDRETSSPLGTDGYRGAEKVLLSPATGCELPKPLWALWRLCLARA